MGVASEMAAGCRGLLVDAYRDAHDDRTIGRLIAWLKHQNHPPEHFLEAALGLRRFMRAGGELFGRSLLDAVQVGEFYPPPLYRVLADGGVSPSSRSAFYDLGAHLLEHRDAYPSRLHTRHQEVRRAYRSLFGKGLTLQRRGNTNGWTEAAVTGGKVRVRVLDSEAPARLPGAWFVLSRTPVVPQEHFAIDDCRSVFFEETFLFEVVTRQGDFVALARVTAFPAVNREWESRRIDYFEGPPPKKRSVDLFGYVPPDAFETAGTDSLVLRLLD